MSDRLTPRTDAAWAKRWDLHDVCPWGLARQLERELAEAVNRLNDVLVAMEMLGSKHERELAEAIKDRDEWKTVAEGRLLESLDKIERQAERIRYLEGATNHATGTPLSKALKMLAEARDQRDRLAEIMRKMWPFIEEDYFPNCATPLFAEAVAEYQSAVKGGQP